MPKCADCGFLCLKPNAGIGLYSAPLEYRRVGSPPTDAKNHVNYEKQPVCLGLVPIDKEIGEPFLPTKVLEIIQRENDCKRFYPWHPGISPEGHQQMAWQEALLTAQLDREQADREWRDARLREDRDWREKQASNEQKWRAKEHRATILGIIVALIVGVAATYATMRASQHPPPSQQNAGPNSEPN